MGRSRPGGPSWRTGRAVRAAPGARARAGAPAGGEGLAHVERPTALEHDELELELVVGSERPVERLELLLGIPEGIQVVEGARALSLRLGWEDERTVKLRLRCDRWGNYRIGDVRLGGP